jgi:hypothetical protein
MRFSFTEKIRPGRLRVVLSLRCLWRCGPWHSLSLGRSAIRSFSYRAPGCGEHAAEQIDLRWCASRCQSLSSSSSSSVFLVDRRFRSLQCNPSRDPGRLLNSRVRVDLEQFNVMLRTSRGCDLFEETRRSRHHVGGHLLALQLMKSRASQ